MAQNSRAPFFEVTLNPDALQILPTAPADVAYVMAPAKKGGGTIDADGVGEVILITNKSTLNDEYGTGAQGSLMSFYVGLIYDYSSGLVKTARVTDTVTLSKASVDLGNDDVYPIPVLKLESKEFSELANNIKVDVEDGTVSGKLVTIFDGTTTEEFDNLADVDAAVAAINSTTTGSALVDASVIGGFGSEVLGDVVSASLTGGDSGDASVPILTYIAALNKAELHKDVTLVVAPGVEDPAFHNAMKVHSELMSNKKNKAFRISFVGSALGLTIAERTALTTTLGSERLCFLGLGGNLIDPETATSRLYAASVVVTSIVGRVFSQPFFVPVIHTGLTNVLDVEILLDADTQDLIHQANMMSLGIEAGEVIVIDAITTSDISAFEDIHLMRIFDQVSRDVGNTLRLSIGRPNSDTTFTWAKNLVTRALNTLKNVGAIADFGVVNETTADDKVQKNFRMKVQIEPILPIKFAFGQIDLVAPQ